MNFRFYTNTISQASKNVAAGIFIVGMVLIGFGFLIYILRDLFAILFAILFCAVGIGCMGTAVKIFWAQRKFNKHFNDDSDTYRKNVRIHTDSWED